MPENRREIGNDRQWVSTRRAAESLGLSERAVRYMCNDGRLAAVRMGRKFRIPVSVVEAAARSGIPALA